MIDVALLSVIRRWHLREGVSIREIARRTQLSRNTVRKYLADGTLTVAMAERPDVRVGETMTARFDPAAALLFDETGHRLR